MFSFGVSSGVNNTPFHKHQQDGTNDQYIKLPLSPLGMLVRHDETYQMPLLDNVQEAFDDLMELCADEDEDGDDADDEEMVSAIHQLLLSIWCSAWKPSEENKMPCIVWPFEMYAWMDPSGNHLESHLTSQGLNI
jgi:hypothetical protein